MAAAGRRVTLPLLALVLILSHLGNSDQIGVSCVQLTSIQLQKQTSAGMIQSISQSDQQADLRFTNQSSESILIGNAANTQVDFLEGKRKKEERQLSLAQTSARAKIGEQEAERLQGHEKVISKTQSITKTEANFFYIDDFFYWLGCKFVTCEKPKANQQAEEKGDKSEKEQEKVTSVPIPRSQKPKEKDGPQPEHKEVAPPKDENKVQPPKVEANQAKPMQVQQSEQSAIKKQDNSKSDIRNGTSKDSGSAGQLTVIPDSGQQPQVQQVVSQALAPEQAASQAKVSTDDKSTQQSQVSQFSSNSWSSSALQPSATDSQQQQVDQAPGGNQPFFGQGQGQSKQLQSISGQASSQSGQTISTTASTIPSQIAQNSPVQVEASAQVNQAQQTTVQTPAPFSDSRKKDKGSGQTSTGITASESQATKKDAILLPEKKADNSTQTQTIGPVSQAVVAVTKIKDTQNPGAKKMEGERKANGAERSNTTMAAESSASAKPNTVVSILGSNNVSMPAIVTDPVQAMEDSVFNKKNPYADFSTFEQKVDDMKPIAPDATNQKLLDQLTKQVDNKNSPEVASVPMAQQTIMPQSQTAQMDVAASQQQPVVSYTSPQPQQSQNQEQQQYQQYQQSFQTTGTSAFSSQQQADMQTTQQQYDQPVSTQAQQPQQQISTQQVPYQQPLQQNAADSQVYQDSSSQLNNQPQAQIQQNNIQNQQQFYGQSSQQFNTQPVWNQDNNQVQQPQQQWIGQQQESNTQIQGNQPQDSTTSSMALMPQQQPSQQQQSYDMPVPTQLIQQEMEQFMSEPVIPPVGLSQIQPQSVYFKP